MSALYLSARRQRMALVHPPWAEFRCLPAYFDCR